MDYYKKLVQILNDELIKLKEENKQLKNELTNKQINELIKKEKSEKTRHQTDKNAEECKA